MESQISELVIISLMNTAASKSTFKVSGLSWNESIQKETYRINQLFIS